MPDLLLIDVSPQLPVTASLGRPPAEPVYTTIDCSTCDAACAACDPVTPDEIASSATMDDDILAVDRVTTDDVAIDVERVRFEDIETMPEENAHIGSSFASFLDERGIREDVERVAAEFTKETDAAVSPPEDRGDDGPSVTSAEPV